MNKTEKKRQKEQYVVEEMIRLYCRKTIRKKKRQEGQMCPDCQRLSDYANKEAVEVSIYGRKRSVRTVCALL